MKITYNILWLDDAIDEFQEDGFVDKINKYLEEEGFIAYIRTVSKVNEFLRYLSEEYDLILMDYNIGDGKNGAELITDIRNKNISTEILFYTAQKEWQQPDRIDRMSFLQTSTINGKSHQESVTEEIIRLIGLTIKKFQHIIAMRGMIMHETSSLDAQIDSIVQAYMNRKIHPEEYTKIEQLILNKLKEQLNNKMTLINRNKFSDIRKDTFLYSADYKRIVLGEILRYNDIDDFTEQYKEEIITIRNKFAHAILKKDEKTGREFFAYKIDGITFDHNFCKKIRTHINKYKEKINQLKDKIKQ